jgi:Flp pilus assembly pilin Flp
MVEADIGSERAAKEQKRVTKEERQMPQRVKSLLSQFHKDERGAMSVEMILILAVIGIPVLILLYIFAKKIIGWFNQADQDLTQQHG